jgi:hypothetical protein
MRAVLAILLLLGPTALPAAVTYMWVDENNERHWSDTPHPGAQQVELTPQNAIRGQPRRLPPARGASAPPATSAAPGYTSCAISQPANDQVFFEIESLTISVRLEPVHRAGDVVTLTVDGAGIAPTSPGGTEFLLASVDRGSHVVVSAVHDASGRTLCSSAPVTFHVRQHSVIKPR